jgi:hypothetical protein
MPDAAVLQQLAPTGKLRIAVAVAPSPSAQFAIEEAKASGLVRKAFDEMGMKTSVVAPAGMRG